MILTVLSWFSDARPGNHRKSTRIRQPCLRHRGGCPFRRNDTSIGWEWLGIGWEWTRCAHVGAVKGLGRSQDRVFVRRAATALEVWTARSSKVRPLGPALTACGPVAYRSGSQPLVRFHAGGNTPRWALGGERAGRSGGGSGVKRWSISVVSEFRKFVKGLVALALCLGTIGAALTFVDVGTAAAATPTLTSIIPVSGLPAGGNKVASTGRVFLRRWQTTSSISAPGIRRL